MALKSPDAKVNSRYRDFSPFNRYKVRRWIVPIASSWIRPPRL